MLSPAERRRARDFNARVSARRGAEHRHAERTTDRAAGERRTIDHPGRSRHIGQHAAGQHAAPSHVVGVHRAPADRGSDEVADLVLLAERLGSAGSQVQADDEFRDRLRQRLIAVASVHGINAEPGFRPPPSVDVEPGARPFPAVRRRIPRRVTVASGTLAGLVALSGVGFASGGANPGDALYGVKRSREAAQLTLARSAVARGQLHLGFARNRLSEAGAATSDPTQLDRLLDDMDSDSRLGMADLGTAAATQHHPAPLDLVDEFTVSQRRGLTRLERGPASPPAAVRRIRASLALLEQIGARSSDLRGVLHCTGPLTSDELGPIAQPCAGSAAEQSPLPSDEPAPPEATWTVRPRPEESDRTSDAPSKDPAGSAASTGQSSPGVSGRKSSAAVPDDGWEINPSSAVENLVPQSGSVLPSPTTGSPIDPLVGSADNTIDSVVGSALTSSVGQTGRD
ncbi:DUF5667 domain-containing protein [Cryptosporangium minutisporangium]|uniref:DUF5667 domain-containing protein n=1 Tax=Cryptosporangium minutisporangium TaxID=113569 RepID=A0ABP6T7U4_9ACTN